MSIPYSLPQPRFKRAVLGHRRRKLTPSAEAEGRFGIWRRGRGKGFGFGGKKGGRDRGETPMRNRDGGETPVETGEVGETPAEYVTVRTRRITDSGLSHAGVLRLAQKEQKS